MRNSAFSPNVASEQVPPDLTQLVSVIRSTAQKKEGDCLALLELLRLLDALHFEIRDTLFCESLPDNRQKLHRLLKDIEQEGGWPYIKRMNLRELLENLEEAREDEASGDTGEDRAK